MKGETDVRNRSEPARIDSKLEVLWKAQAILRQECKFSLDFEVVILTRSSLCPRGAPQQPTVNVLIF